ncbi:MAG: hypothetical protein C4316_06075 [Chloroflexota bacterium]
MSSPCQARIPGNAVAVLAMVGETGLRPGTVVGDRYLVRHKAGEGGLAEVYLAEDLASGRQVALKLGRQGAPFQRTLSPPAHPNLAQLLDSGRWAGRPYEVFEWVEGTDLDTYLQVHGPLDVPTACRLAAQVAAGLAALHEAGLVHGDVKPRNVLVISRAEGPNVKLIDVGPNSDPGGPVLATPLYAAPEVLAGSRPTPAADAYGLGILLFELLTGLRPPPEPEHRTGLRPAEWNPAVPPGLDRLVARLTASDPADRPPKLQGVGELLGAYGSPNATPTVPLGSATVRLRRGRPAPGSRLKTAPLVALLVALALLVAPRAAELLPAGEPAGQAVRAAPAVPETVRVPAVVNLPVGQAVEVMVAVGLRPATRQAYSSQGFGLVVWQDPPAGTELAPGTSITLTVSIGPPPVQADDNHRRDRGPGKKRGRDD